ncbi:RIP metalloprotease RseP [Telmatospirillum sp.]|uniref:RIP metalloprotease RseP n=1 Tax=Telmatospirillum sp. TaxID=2079197 RepID=UPI00284A70A6|nr:RIP metalloprotease RseP [Telmatospirillum sp.]MDR3436690.1 RIP metalloprotease RseP [Telmatospirillum sp.]
MHLLVGFWDYVVIFLVILTVVVFVHEMGHFLVARWNGVRVEVFSIGFGPELFAYTAKSGTRWKVGLLPLGGYVKMFGDADAASTPDFQNELPPDLQQFAFRYKKVHQRAAIVAAGPLMNFVFGIVVLAGMFMIYGQPRTAPVIGQVQADSAAAEAGLQVGDRVREANSQKVDRFQDLQRIVRMTVGEPVTLVVERAGNSVEVVAHPRVTEVKDVFGNAHKTPVLGIVADPDSTEIIHYDPASALWAATLETGEMVSSTLVGLGQMATGQRETDELGGPLRIAKGAGQAAQLGIGSVVFYTILLSINLGLINLFPVPLLDGGHLLFYGIEALQGRPLGPRAQEYGFRIGLILVFALMLFATRNDLVDLRVWEFIKGLVS